MHVHFSLCMHFFVKEVFVKQYEPNNHCKYL